jgi:hypothetical protein
VRRAYIQFGVRPMCLRSSKGSLKTSAVKRVSGTLIFAVYFVTAVNAFGYPRPPLGAEPIPEMMQEASLVCKGEVTSAPTGTLDEKPRMSGTAWVRLDRCFKGDVGRSPIPLAVDQYYAPGGGPTFFLKPGDYRLLFLTLKDGRYMIVNEWFGALKASRNLSSSDRDADTPMASLERDLEAGLQDKDTELVLESIRMLGNMRALHSTVELKSFLGDRDPIVRTYVWQALLRLKDYSVLSAVAEFFASQPLLPYSLTLPRDRLLYMQRELVGEIGGIRSSEALPFLETFAVSKDPALRRDALQAIRQIRSPHSIPVLLNELDDPDRHNSFSAMQGLLSLRSANSSNDWVPTMEQFLQSPDVWIAKTRQWWEVEGKVGLPDSSLPASR